RARRPRARRPADRRVGRRLLRRRGDGQLRHRERGARRDRRLPDHRRRRSAARRRDLGSVSGVSELAQRLGYDADARLVILSCDDLGSCHAANVGVYEAIRTGHATCASIMVPAPWAMHAAEMYEPTDDIGVHLTLNAEHPTYRWGPITQAPSLLSG